MTPMLKQLAADANGWLKVVVTVGVLLVSLALAWGKVETRVAISETRIDRQEHQIEQESTQNRQEHQRIMDRLDLLLQRVPSTK